MFKAASSTFLMIPWMESRASESCIIAVSQQRPDRTFWHFPPVRIVGMNYLRCNWPLLIQEATSPSSIWLKRNSKLNLRFQGKQAIPIDFQTRGGKFCFSQIAASVQLSWQEICLTHLIWLRPDSLRCLPLIEWNTKLQSSPWTISMTTLQW